MLSWIGGRKKYLYQTIDSTFKTRSLFWDSNLGWTVLTLTLCLDIQVYIQTKAQEDFSSLERVQFLNESFMVHEKDFKTIPQGSLVVLDDFSLKRSKTFDSKSEYLKIINYHLRHNKITLILIIHNMYNNHLFTEILLSPHLFLAYSNLGYYIIRYTPLLSHPPTPLDLWAFYSFSFSGKFYLV